jgi:hypothetical protein
MEAVLGKLEKEDKHDFVAEKLDIHERRLTEKQ